MLVLSFPGICAAEIIVAKRTIPSHSILAIDDFDLKAGDVPNAVIDPVQVRGLESLRVLYKGRPVLLSDVGPAAIIERNQIVTLIFVNGSLTISAQARSLGRASVGEQLRVMNLGSRRTVAGIVHRNGQVVVGAKNPIFQE